MTYLGENYRICPINLIVFVFSDNLFAKIQNHLRIPDNLGFRFLDVCSMLDAVFWSSFFWKRKFFVKVCIKYILLHIPGLEGNYCWINVHQNQLLPRGNKLAFVHKPPPSRLPCYVFYISLLTNTEIQIINNSLNTLFNTIAMPANLS